MKRGRAASDAPRRRAGLALPLALASVTVAGAGLVALGLPQTGKPPRVLVLGSPEPPPSPLPGSLPSAAEQARAESLQGIPVAQVSFVETRVDVRGPGGEWRPLPEGGRVHTGDRLRVGAASVARLEFPWMGIALAPGAELEVARGTILSLRLETGRAELSSGRDEMIKLDTPEARLRGRGWIVVRREHGTTRVSVLRGELRVRAARSAARLVEGYGCVVEPERDCVPRLLPDAPTGLSPGSDPVYVAAGEHVTLTWPANAAARFHVQVMNFEDDTVLMQRDVDGPPFDLAVPWPGLYRWRVSRRGSDDVEGRPSLEGLLQVMPPQWLSTKPESR